MPASDTVFVSRWDAGAASLPEDLKMQLGVATACETWIAYRDYINGNRWQRLRNEGARPQRLLWASTGTKDPEYSDVYYVEALAAPFTVNTMPEDTLLAFADHGTVKETLGIGPNPANDALLARFEAAGVNIAELADRLQEQGTDAFISAWRSLIGLIERKAAVPGRA